MDSWTVSINSIFRSLMSLAMTTRSRLDLRALSDFNSASRSPIKKGQTQRVNQEIEKQITENEDYYSDELEYANNQLVSLGETVI